MAVLQLGWGRLARVHAPDCLIVRQAPWEVTSRSGKLAWNLEDGTAPGPDSRTSRCQHAYLSSWAALSRFAALDQDPAASNGPPFRAYPPGTTECQSSIVTAQLGNTPLIARLNEVKRCLVVPDSAVNDGNLH